MKKILFVDDNQHLHSLMTRLLAFMGYESIGAASAKEGLEKAASEKPDVILLDIGLPDMDGRDTARLLRSDPVTKYIPILAFTAIFDPAFSESCLEAGCDDYVVKPVAHQLLQEKLQRLLDPRRH
jgi:two-component system, cell cycle response regulator DivK